MQKVLTVLLLMVLLTGCSSAAEPKELNSGVQEVGGTVLGGGDQTPEGLMDAPRTFIYQVKLDSGEEINFSYTAYPPSPVNENQTGPKLTFHAGTINVGDYVKIKGTYDTETKTLIAALEDDYIETFSKKP